VYKEATKKVVYTYKHTYKLYKYILVFSAKSPINYGDLGVSESLQDIYKRGQAFSIKGDNFSWSYVGISFSYGDKKAIYGRALKSDGTYDPQMITRGHDWWRVTSRA